MGLRELSKAEKELYLLGYLKAKSEDLADSLKISEAEAREILINGLRDRLAYEKK